MVRHADDEPWYFLWLPDLPIPHPTLLRTVEDELLMPTPTSTEFTAIPDFVTIPGILNNLLKMETWLPISDVTNSHTKTDGCMNIMEAETNYNRAD